MKRISWQLLSCALMEKPSRRGEKDE